MALLKNVPNLRQEYRELVSRANGIGIKARLEGGYLYYTDKVSSATMAIKRRVWADNRALSDFQKIVIKAEQIAKEREGVSAALRAGQIALSSLGVKIDWIGEWWFHYETTKNSGFLPLLNSSQQHIFILAAEHNTTKLG